MLLWSSTACRGGTQQLGGYDDVSCVMGSGMKLTIASVVLWFLSSVSICFIPPTEFDDEDDYRNTYHL